MNSPNEAVSVSPINYDSPPLVELSLGDIDYRIDAGKQGTALCISLRKAGTWDWAFGGEARWDARSLRCKAFPRNVLEPLSSALGRALEDAS